MSEPLRVLFATSECAPWSKTGGLADVSAAMPAALRGLGVDIRVLMPAYPSVPTSQAELYARIPQTPRFPAAELLAATLPNQVPALLVRCQQLYARDGGPYQDAGGRDWNDNALRFGQLCRVAAMLATNDKGAWRPHIVHCNDWQTGLVPAYLRYAPPHHVASIITVHNLAFQGVFPARVVSELELPLESFSIDGLEFYGQCSFLKAGLAYADALTTVSPTYAAEIQTEAQGMGLHGLLYRRRGVLNGILNGIDTSLWDPATDVRIPRRYNVQSLDQKLHNKRALQFRARLPQTNALLLAVISRLTDQKGIDNVLEIAPALAQLPAQLVVLGNGESRYEQALLQLTQDLPDSLSVTIGFDETYAHVIEAGADAFLMPSRFEPCGMNQMYSQRYGTLPIVRATGGLIDSVRDQGRADGSGFLFQESTGAALFTAIGRAAKVYRDPSAWRRLQINGMKRDFSWSESARRYLDIYQRIAQRA